MFTLIPLAGLKRRDAIKHLPPGERYLTIGVKQLVRTLAKVRTHPQAMLFLGAFLLYNDGIQTVISLAAVFGQEEIGLPMSTLTAVILLVQFVGFFGAIVFNGLARFLTAKRAIMLSLLLWIGVLVYAFAFLHDALGFWLMAAVIAWFDLFKGARRRRRESTRPRNPGISRP